MAKIVANENAPADATGVYSLGGHDFELTGSGHETDNRALLVEAEVHPWLSVEYGEQEAATPAWRDDPLSASEDVLTAENSEAFDQEAVKRDREAVLGDGSDYDATAIDAGLDQGEVHYAGDVATTVAADDADSYDDDDERDE